ncbi:MULTISPECIES: cyclophane-forming radical SAM/SPASM peptide maturase YhhB [Pelosinus]|uniref:Radical SAM domain protein n=1 Tax=Pelosinus fermentans B4 TaxID=1149862 RepID=I9LGF3_9FIRM|nr:MULTISPECIES: cyclophane-forming radical SAM/SPASM peptide maturase YhhB [Pelosinus]EIW19584.1 Radical SAM domain protein [Pelosinus fermentans B4]EIW24683.1 Radical SAM domain protein [Pelosinus fermentans A11]OAM96037.1 Radical SAM domain protein [Pelosinus fermentans DSM 17108]SDR35637.1 radical SAM/SPASM domain protein, FxsB family [Pelosinus fermentans]
MEKIKTFFLRVAARCNLDCNYCYVFKHRDMSWKNYPPTMSKEHVVLFSHRLKEYVMETKLKEVYIIYHGGEPLFIGESVLLEYTDIILKALDGIVSVEFSLQTNGTLLTDKFLEECDRRKIKISLSIDGPEDIHNKNRKMANGDGSFNLVFSGIQKVQKYPHLFQGAIGVIDPYSNPEQLMEFYNQTQIFNVDLLLPDANYESPPKYREAAPYIYKNWLIESFDAWFDKYQDLSLRTYENVLKRLLDCNTSTDSFGFGKLDYLTIEVDGSYHTTDILKVAFENASAMGISLENATINQAATHKKVEEYNMLLAKENLPQKCKSCDVGYVCGGGALPHRYSEINSFDNPTIYCNEMRSLINHAKKRLNDEVENELLL